MKEFPRCTNTRKLTPLSIPQRRDDGSTLIFVENMVHHQVKWESLSQLNFGASYVNSKEAKFLERILTTHVHHSLVYKHTLLVRFTNFSLSSVPKKSEEKHNSSILKYSGYYQQ